MTTKHVTVQEHATSGLDEHQEPGRRDEVHKTVADGLVLVEVDAIVGKVELAGTAGVWRTFDVCAGHCGSGAFRQGFDSPGRRAVEL